MNRFGFEILVKNAKRRFWRKMQKAVQLAPINAMIAVTALAIAVMMNMFTYCYILIDIMPRYRALSQTIDHSH